MNDFTLPLRSINGDRKIGSAAWRALFATYFTNGIFANPSTNLQVLENGNMTTVVKVGKAHIDGVFTYKRQDTIIQHDIADGLLKRIDRIVLRLDETLRDMPIVLKKGTPSSTPVPPSVQRDAEAYELVLADVFIDNGVTQITQANITDQRLNSALCGVVASTINELDTTTLFNQYQSWINQEKARFENDVDGWLASEQLDFETWRTTVEDTFNQWMQQEQSDFETWFATLQDLLDENVAATLTAKVQSLENSVSDLETNKANSTDLSDLQTQVTQHLDEIGDIEDLETNDKTNLVAAINETFTQVVDGKELIATAINDKGGNVSGSETFSDLSNAIGLLGGGIKSIQSGIHSMISVVTSTFNINAVNTENSIVLLFNYNPQYKTASTTVRSSFNSTTQVKLERSNADLNYECVWYVIEFDSLKSRQIGTLINYNASREIKTVSINPVNMSKSIVLTNLFNLSNNTTDPLYSFGLAYLSKSDELTARLGGTLSMEWNVLEFN